MTKTHTQTQNQIKTKTKTRIRSTKIQNNKPEYFKPILKKFKTWVLTVTGPAPEIKSFYTIT